MAKLVTDVIPDNVTKYRDSILAGTMYYIDPEYHRTGTVRPKSDLYALGIIILQLLALLPPKAVISRVESAIDCGKLFDMLDDSVPDWPLAEVLPVLKKLHEFGDMSRKFGRNRNDAPSHFYCPIVQDQPKLLKARKSRVQVSALSSHEADSSIKIGILGASGYTGAELIRLSANHPHFKITLLTADRKAGQSIGSVFPHLLTRDLPNLVAVKDANFSDVDAVFCCLPHGATQETIKGLPNSLKIVDLSADFRLRQISEYAEWYGQPHKASELQKEAVYGLTEIYRNKIQSARLVANPGCYPTTVLLPLVPLIKAGLIELQDIVIVSSSGLSGAGRFPKEGTLYTEASGGMCAYGITRHRHMPEIEQELSVAANSKVTVSFTPKLTPMIRGMHSTINVKMSPGASVDDLKQDLVEFYEKEEFVTVLPGAQAPNTKHVQGSNGCLINVFPDHVSRKAMIISVIDNLVKGASGQAMQNLNLMMGLPENTGLNVMPTFP